MKKGREGRDIARKVEKWLGMSENEEREREGGKGGKSGVRYVNWAERSRQLMLLLMIKRMGIKQPERPSQCSELEWIDRHLFFNR